MGKEQHAVLVVDDLLDWRRTIGGLLRDEGYAVEVAPSAESALETLAKGRFDLAVIDIRLDERDEDNTAGLDLAAEIKKRWSGVKVVLITGYGTPKIIDQAFEPDAQGRRLVDDYIPKTKTEELVEMVQRVLAQ